MKKKPEWTLIFLLSAKNNLFNEQLKVIEEIYSVGSSKDVNFVILFDAIGGDKFSKKFAAPSIYHATKEADFLTDTSFDSLSGNARGLTTTKNLEILLRKVVKYFPADNFGFFYKGHGAPAETDISKGIFNTRMVLENAKMSDARIETKYKNAEPGWDYEGCCEYPTISKGSKKLKPVLLIYSKGNTKALSYSSLANVIQKVFKRKKPGFICMDCCWAQQIENANDFVGLTDYFIASPDEMPALGLGYTHLCNHFVKRPSIKSREVANLLVSIFYFTNYADYDSDVPEYRKMGVSFTGLSLAAFKSFKDNFKELCTYLIDKLKQKDDKTYILIHNARDKCLDYTYQNTENLPVSKIDYYMFNIDLIWFLENLLFYNINVHLEEKIFNVVNSLQNELIVGFLGNNYKKISVGSKAIGGNGIAICFPVNKKQAAVSILKKKKMPFFKETGWKDLLQLYYDYKLPKIISTAKGGTEFKGLTIEEALQTETKPMIFKKAKKK